MQLFLNNNLAKNRVIDLFLKILTIMILSINVSLILYDIDISSMRNGTLKGSLEDWNVWWSTWTAQIILFGSFILLLFHLKILFTDINKLQNTLLIKFIFYLRISTATSVFFTLIVFNGAAFISKSLIIYDPVYFRSDIEHVVTPILFCLYYFITIRNIKFSEQKFFKYFSYNFMFILIYPTFYLINLIFLGIVENAFPYSEFNWKTESISLFFIFLLAAYTAFILFGMIFYFPARIRKKKLVKEKRFTKYKISNSEKLFNNTIVINSLFTFFFINCFIGIWSRSNHFQLSLFLLIFIIGNLLTLLFFYYYQKNNSKNSLILFSIFNYIFTFGISGIFFSSKLLINKNKMTIKKL